MSTPPPMATPRVAAGVVFRDQAGGVLLVKPTYKTGWDVPGGYVEPGESPRDAARREVREEVGLEAQVGRLLVVDWAPHPKEGDKLLFLFDGGNLSEAPPSAAPEEIERAQFWQVEHLADALPDRLRDRILSALRESGDVYLEHGVAGSAT